MLNSKSAESTACNTDPLYSSVSTCSNQRSVATNTSTLWPQIQSGLRKLTETLNEEEGGEEDSYSNVGEIRKSAIGVTEYLLIMNFIFHQKCFLFTSCTFYHILVFTFTKLNFNSNQLYLPIKRHIHEQNFKLRETT